MNVKLFIATPAFDGRVHVPFALSLSETTLLCARNHIQVEYRVMTSGSLLCAERNRLIKSFLESDCTHMLCIDSDLGWPPQSVLALLEKNVEFVAGVYPARQEKAFLFRPSTNENGSIVTDPIKGLLKMEYIPAGFMLLQRSVLEKMIEKHPQTKFQPKDERNESGYALFNTEVFEGEFWGEDYVFCRLAREAGIDIWVDPMIQFNHAGSIGMLAQVLSDKPPEKQNKE